MPRIKNADKSEEDPNAKWQHALSLQDTKLWQDKQNELDFMRDMFFDKMPMGPDKDKLNEYFNLVQQAIDNKDPNLQNDEFSSFAESVDIDGAVKDPPTTYHYYQSLLLEQQAKQEFQRELLGSIEAEHQHCPEPQTMDDPTDERGPEASQDEPAQSESFSYYCFSEESDNSQASEQ